MKQITGETTRKGKTLIRIVDSKCVQKAKKESKQANGWIKAASRDLFESTVEVDSNTTNRRDSTAEKPKRQRLIHHQKWNIKVRNVPRKMKTSQMIQPKRDKTSVRLKVKMGS